MSKAQKDAAKRLRETLLALQADFWEGQVGHGMVEQAISDLDIILGKKQRAE